MKTNNYLKFCVNYTTRFLFIVLMLCAVDQSQAQTTFYPTVSGGWDGAKIQGAGYLDYGNGVVRLLDAANNGCEGAAIFEMTDKYNPCTGNFNKCYQVVFGCDDDGADGLAFTFSNCTNATDYQVWGCGGGLGYVDGCSNNKGITIEFDTFNNGGADDFDTGYEGTGTQDQIAIHKNMQAKTTLGKVTGVAVPNLEDGLEHRVCIVYDYTTHVLSASIDGSSVISYDMDNAGLEFQSYFGGCGGLNQSWSAGTNGGFNNQVISNGANIYGTTGEAAKICPQMLPVTFLNVEAKVTPSSSVLVSWITASETNNQKFIIERSGNGTDWFSIGEVAGAGNSTSILNYTFEDEAALSGTSYYRVVQVDFDGKNSSSKIVSVRPDSHLNILPNPFNDVLTISDISGNVDVTIQDVLGRPLYHLNKEIENGSLEIRPDLAPGFYMITVQTNTFIERREIIKGK